MTNSTSSLVKNFSFFKSSYLPKENSQGFSLIEVLITMIIISFGMLGLAKLQLNAMVGVQSASYANKAANFAQQMTEIIATNPSAFNSYQLSANQQITLLNDCTINNCTSSELAKHDVKLWQINISKSLPAGQAEIVTDANQVNVIVRWDQNRNGSSGLNCPQLSSNDLECVTLTRKIK